MIEIINAEALKVGPDQVLVIRLPDDASTEIAQDFAAELERLGITHRVLLFSWPGVELVVFDR